MPVEAPTFNSDAVGNALLADLALPTEEPKEPEVAAPEVAETPEVEPEPSVVEDVAEAGDGPTPEAPVSEDEIRGWAAKIRENPKTITGVPGALRAAVIESLINDASEHTKAEIAKVEEVRLRAVRDALEMGAAQAREQMRIDGYMQVAQQLESSDPQGFVRWLNEAPQNGPAYWQWKAQGAMPRAGSNGATDTIRASAAALLTDLSEWPDLRDEAAREATEKNIQADPEGLRQFTRIVSAKLAAASQRSNSQPPAIKDAVDAAKALPRPSGGTPSSTSQKPNPAVSNDPTTLLSLGMRDIWATKKD